MVKVRICKCLPNGSVSVQGYSQKLFTDGNFSTASLGIPFVVDAMCVEKGSKQKVCEKVGGNSPEDSSAGSQWTQGEAETGYSSVERTSDAWGLVNDDSQSCFETRYEQQTKDAKRGGWATEEWAKAGDGEVCEEAGEGRRESEVDVGEIDGRKRER